METTPNYVNYTDPSDYVDAIYTARAAAWVANPSNPAPTRAADGSPLYCPTHGRYVGYKGVFPCRKCSPDAGPGWWEQ